MHAETPVAAEPLWSRPSPLASGVDEAPPTVDDLANDPKFNRKREREGSIEPSTPSASAPGEIRDQRSPAKKNRVVLSATSEEDSPPHSSSKVSQIRERVKGLNWKDGEDVPEDIDPDKDAEATPSPSAGIEPVSSNALQIDPSTEEDIKESRELSRSSLSNGPAGSRLHEPTAASASSSTPAQDATPIKIGGFAAYSSRPSPFVTTAASSTSFLDRGPKLPPPAKPTGFAAFASSPFADLVVASSGSKSPLRVSSPTPQSTSAFSMFANKSSPFLSSSPKPPSTPAARGSTPKSGEAFGSYSNSPTHFGASFNPSDGGESECKENKFGNIEEVDIHTGEEHEKTVHQTRAKLYTMDSRDTYKERGTGLLKVNVRKSDGRGGRLVMRADGVFRLILNASLFTGMPCSLGQDPKFVKLSVIEDGAFIHHAIKVGNVKVAQDLVDTIQAHIPQPSSLASPKPSAD
ncbi:hypothetical protein BS47DRAFT_1384988 [Hydnum rufescens UP504]|uniref:RanBD1 domain-containing protein n=1 Tax=Hydnum rufescens UP504 TaxID=1448309 RepID=A0A9P6AMY2_9AGAM|nr:hypothetical protein BS47DRAFT_1384988 [Hydnum rufescens UP504]